MLNQTNASDVRGCQTTERPSYTTAVAGSGAKEWKLSTLEIQVTVLSFILFELFPGIWDIMSKGIAVWTLDDIKTFHKQQG